MELNKKLPLVIATAIFLNLSGAIVSKYMALNIGNLYFLMFFFLLLVLIYGARMKYWVWAGKRYQLSYLYPFVSLSYVIALFFGYFLFQELLSTQKLIGSMLIVLGVFIVSKSTNKI